MTLAANASLTVSGDHDLISRGRLRDIRSRAAREALDLITSAAR